MRAQDFLKKWGAAYLPGAPLIIHVNFLAFCLMWLGFGNEVFNIFWPGLCHSSLGDATFSQGVRENGVHNRSHCLLDMSFLLHSMWMKSLLGLDDISFGRLVNIAEMLSWRDCFSDLQLLSRFCSSLWQHGDWITLPQRPGSLLSRYFGFCRFLTGCRLCLW